MENNIKILSTIYDRVIPINDKYCIVSSKRKYGIINAVSGDVLLPIKYTEYYIYTDSGIVVMFDLMDASTTIFNINTGRHLTTNNLYRFSNNIKEALFFHQVRTSSGLVRSMIIRRDTMRVILEPTVISVIEPVNSDGIIVRMKFFNSGYNLDNLFYSLTDEYEIRIDGVR